MSKDDDYLDEDFTDYRFSELVAELERTGEILKQWEQGESIEKEPKTETKNNENEKERRTI